jgi:uncharacterized protein YidB (DUF937 family)
MGLLDQIAGVLDGQMGGGAGQNQMMQLVMQLLQHHPGGLQGLIEQFTRAGLGQQAASWVSTGQNLPISADDLMKVFGGGGGQLQDLLSKLGMNQGEAMSGLAQVLPGVVDRLTPNGSVQDDMVAQGLNLLKNLKI